MYLFSNLVWKFLELCALMTKIFTADIHFCFKFEHGWIFCNNPKFIGPLVVATEAWMLIQKMSDLLQSFLEIAEYTIHLNCQKAVLIELNSTWFLFLNYLSNIWFEASKWARTWFGQDIELLHSHWYQHIIALSVQWLQF